MPVEAAADALRAAFALFHSSVIVKVGRFVIGGFRSSRARRPRRPARYSASNPLKPTAPELEVPYA